MKQQELIKKQGIRSPSNASQLCTSNNSVDKNLRAYLRISDDFESFVPLISGWSQAHDVIIYYIVVGRAFLRKNKQCSRESDSFVHLEHCNTCLQNYDLNCFKVIDQANCNFDCCIKEALLIKRLQPNLNSNMYSGNSFQLKVF